MINFLLGIVYLILEFFIYLLMPFTWICTKTEELRENTENKFTYILVSIPMWVFFPFACIWLMLMLWEIDILTEIKINKNEKRYGKLQKF